MDNKKYYLKTRMNEQPPIYIFLGMSAALSLIIFFFCLIQCETENTGSLVQSAYVYQE